MRLNRLLPNALRAARSRLRRDEGFSMVVTMGVLTMLVLSAMASVQAVVGDQPAGRSDLQRKAAFAAAESGLQVYFRNLADDNTYWTKCTGNGPADAVNIWVKNAPDTRRWANLPDNTARYTLEQLPVNENVPCSAADPATTMVDPATATFRVRATGQSLSPSGQPVGPRRSVIATFKRRSFLDYIYFTDFEVQDPAVYPSMFAAGSTNTRENAGNNDIDADGHQRTIQEWGDDVCAVYAYLDAKNGKKRTAQKFTGNQSNTGQYNGSSWSSLTKTGCPEITFATDDVVEGPLHTNDAPLLCGSPAFGRRPTDAIETVAPGNASITDVVESYRVTCGSGAPDANLDGGTSKPTRGTWLMNQPSINLPPSNTALREEANSAYTFLGFTRIVLGSTTMTVSGIRKSDGVTLTNATMAYPANGVVYVDHSSLGCPSAYSAANPYASRPGCGQAYVSGAYGKSLTVASADDIVINGNITNAGTASTMLGLIADGFIRMYHPVNDPTSCRNGASGSSTTSAGGNASGSLSNPTVEAAILTLNHSFTVDNYWCGSALGKLTIKGAIAQKFRGVVAKGTSTGYIKNYVYNDLLKTLAPPKFLDPVEASWRILTYQEQSPAT